MTFASTLLAGAAALPLPPPVPGDPPGVELSHYVTRLPKPPPLPADPPMDEAAPVPNANVMIPGGHDAASTEFALRIYPMRQYGTSDAFPPGSAYQSPEERKPMQPPGFIVTVPLQ